MSRTGEEAALRVVFTTDAPGHDEAKAIAAWLGAAPGVKARAVALDEALAAEADVVWIHGVRPVRLEALGKAAPDALLGGGVLLTGGAATLPAAAGVDSAAPNEVGRSPWPEGPDDDGLPPLRGHAAFRSHPLFDRLGPTAITSEPAAGEEHTRVAYVLPLWPARGRVVAVERSRLRIHADRATIWEYDGAAGRTICIGGFLPLHGRGEAARASAGILAANALRRAARGGTAADAGRAEPRSGEAGEWRRPEGAAAEDRALSMPELPLLEDALGSLDFRLRATGPAEGDGAFHVAGRRAFAAGGAARGLDEIWAHPVRLAAGLRLRGAVGEASTVTPVGMERQLRLGDATVLERLVVPREAPACVVEWLSRSRSVDVEVGWTCDLRLAAPYPAGWQGPLRWRRAPRGVVVAGGEERVVFAFSTPPESLEVRDVSGEGRPLVRIRARVRLEARKPVRLAIAGAAGDAALRRALGAADRTSAMSRSRAAHTERLLSERLSLECADTAAVQALEWSKHRLDACLAEAPGVGRSLLGGYGSSPDAPDDAATPVGARFHGPAAARGALACLAVGDPRSARDVLSFLGRHLDARGRVLHECSTSGVARHDDPSATPLYLLLVARYLAWTGDLPFVRAEWPRTLSAYDAAVRLFPEGGGGAGADVLGGALAELGEAAESIGERGAAVELRQAAARRGGAPWQAELGVGSPVTSLVHGVLRAEPDATRGRLVLRPEPPSAWPRFRVSGLRVGDAEVGVGYRRLGATHTFRLSQGRGATPLRVILEPALPGERLTAAAVDGEAAELDAHRRGDRLVVPVQVVLDHEREVVLEIDRSMELERRPF
ncbi:MAG: hypothetical protein KY466_00350 [Gemmatimonadetes bacterium]|nr:hypothetical protein [Gemmatimonadota bacterium]